MDPCISLLCAAVGRALPASHCSARLSLLFSAYAAVGCAKDCVAVLRLSHQNSQEPLLYYAAARTPMWVARCLRCIRTPHCARRCGLRIAFVASECRRIASGWAKFYNIVNRDSLIWSCAKASCHFSAARCVRRCGPRIAYQQHWFHVLG